MKNCKYCNNNLDIKKQKYFCSQRCKALYQSRVKKNNPFLSKKIQSNLGKRGCKKSHIVCKSKKLGWWSSELQSKMGKRAVIKNMKNKTGFYDPKIQSLGGTIGSKIANKILRDKKRIKFKNMYYSSYGECEIAMCIHYQLEKLIERENYQVAVSSITIDFFIKKYKCFIDYHPHINFYKKSTTEYYDWRRNILDNNGYKNYNLVVIIL